MAKKIHVVINPGSGQPQPVLHTLNSVFRTAKVDWDISLTHKNGDAEKYARQATASGVDVVAAYGGDGTVMEVARGVLGSQSCLAILPGGTANLMSVELGIPKDLAQAASIAASSNSQVRQVDMGKIGETYFLLRVGLGFAARKVGIADRQLKDKYGILAYSIGALKALQQSRPAHYHITLDGQKIEAQGLTCLVDNAGNMGVAGFSAAHNISVSDGLLDVILVRNAGFRSWVAMGENLVNATPDPNSFHHWQARQITIEVDPEQPVQVDGEMAGSTPVTINVIPQAVRVLVGE
jgi:YegS/Rv2252/BmrU family lipid kinase